MFEIVVKGKIYQVTELNKRSGLYEICYNGIFHTIGKSAKTREWLYIRKSAFSPFLPVQEIISVLEPILTNETHEKH